MAVPAQAQLSDVKRKREMLNPLDRKPRPFEYFIQVVLFLCGVASIFTTVGIVLTLGIEASHFFTTPGTIAVERQFAQALEAYFERCKQRGVEPSKPAPTGL